MKKFEFIFNTLLTKGKMSIGRLLLFSTFVLAYIKWCFDIEIQPSQLTILLSLLAYVLGSKFLNILRKEPEKTKDKEEE